MIGSRQPLVTHLVNTTHDVDEVLPQIGRSPRRRQLVRSIDRITGHATDHFVALTSAVAESARRNLDIKPEKLSIIPRAVDLDHFLFVGPKDRDRFSSIPVHLRRPACAAEVDQYGDRRAR